MDNSGSKPKIGSDQKTGFFKTTRDFLGRILVPSSHTEDSYWQPAMNFALIVTLIVLLMSTIVSTPTTGADGVVATDWSIGWSAIMVAATAIAGGALLGFLFGIPRAQSGATGIVDNKELTEEQRRNYLENTNLEQISDWLTKILIGVGLVQFKEFSGALWNLSEKLGPVMAPNAATGDNQSAVSFVIIIFFIVFGFLYMYLWTRIYMIKLLQEARLAVEDKQARRNQKAK